MEKQEYKESKILNPDSITVSDNDDRVTVLQKFKKIQDLCRKLDKIIEYAPDGIYVTDGEANIIRVNPAFCQMSGIDRKEILGKPSQELEDNHLVLQSNHLEVVRKKKIISNIVHYPQNNKTALVTSIPVLDNQDRIELIVSSTRDLTELNELKDKLAAEHEKTIRYEKQIEFIKDTTQEKLIAVDKRMLDLLYMARRVAFVDASVLITGETGCGKEEVAHYIHDNSNRADKPFIAINCGAIPEDLVESELFGYEKGAFTGARSEGKIGIFEAARGGTVFLDEVGELSLSIQVKLLRAIENRIIHHVGGVKNISIDIRIISATNRNIPEMIQQGLFREDLYYRLNVVPIKIPPLRERKEDIIPLADHFLKYANDKYNMKKRFSNAAYRVMYHYRWPGNVRELKNIVERVVIMSDHSIILAEELPMYADGIFLPEKNNNHLPIKERLQRIEWAIMKEACQMQPSLHKAAESIQMSWPTFVRKRALYKKKFGENC